MQKVFSDESYANSLEIYLERLKGDVWTIEATENNFPRVVAVRPLPESSQEEDRGGRDQPSDAAGRFRRTSSPSGSAAAWSTFRPTSWCCQPTAVSGGRVSTAIWRFSRPWESRWRTTSCSRNSGWSHGTYRRPTSGWLGTSCPTTSRSRTSSRCGDPLVAAGDQSLERQYRYLFERTNRSLPPIAGVALKPLSSPGNSFLASSLNSGCAARTYIRPARVT